MPYGLGDRRQQWRIGISAALLLAIWGGFALSIGSGYSLGTAFDRLDGIYPPMSADADGDGLVDETEYDSTFAQSPSWRMRIAFPMLDANGDGRIDPVEAREVRPVLSTLQTVHTGSPNESFPLIDSDGDGYLTFAELRHAGFEAWEARQFLGNDNDGDGALDIVEWAFGTPLPGPATPTVPSTGKGTVTAPKTQQPPSQAIP